MIFLLSASGMSLSNEYSSKILRILYLNVLLITSCGVQAGSHLLKKVLGSDTF